MENTSNTIYQAEDNQDEILLYEESEKDEERIEQSESEVEIISDEEYMLECARYGDYEDLRNLFEENKAIDINYTDNRQNTALHMACANSHFNVIKLLVEQKKANLNLKNNAGNTPLHWSAVNGLKEVVIYLVENGAEVSIKNNQNKVAAEEAYEKSFLDIAEYLVDKEIELNKDKGKIEENFEMEIEMTEEIEIDIKEEMDGVDLNK